MSRGLSEIAANILQRTQGQLPFDPDTAAELIFAGFGLADQLMEKLTRTMILELNVARLEGVLQGETPQERFQSFLKRLRRQEVAVGILRSALCWRAAFRLSR